MNKITFNLLLRWEIQRMWRKPIVLIALLLLSLAMLFGALSGKTLHHSQTESIYKNQQYTTDWYAEIKASAKRYSTAVQPDLPYWQDPTNVSGFSRYFLKQFAYKPHLALSPIAVGNSDLLPSRLPVKLETSFGIDPQYDFENPRSLALGQFDLTFVVVYLLPIVILLLAALLTTLERDNGSLRLIAAQPITPRAWLGARLAALFIYVLPSIFITVWFALWLTSVPIFANLAEILTIFIVIAAYTLFWFSICFVVLSYWLSAAGAMSVLIGIWGGLLIGMPMLLNIIQNITIDPPSYLEYVNKTRHEQDLVNSEASELVAKAFKTHPMLAGNFDTVPTIDYATRLTFLAPELEKRLQPMHEEIEKSRQNQQQFSSIAEYLSPSLGVINALSVIAGTNSTRHHLFLAQTRDYQLQLREMFYTRIYQQLINPSLKPEGSSGQFSFTAYDQIPEFVFQEPSVVSRLIQVIRVTVCLLLLSMLIAFARLRHLHTWPEDL
ncbi:DUF3526 domain-containing protein [Paraglaciecola sp. L3A3]|uniref:DUF3526 domain-containing protein n=1 Tax=Paraglaciecola sp. L3A3 TaxID=2686358 RepID=UPI00131CE8CB|nr:DUF3526 domain-containing protein [Paraglaciecola sp. L3A3]